MKKRAITPGLVLRFSSQLQGMVDLDHAAHFYCIQTYHLSLIVFEIKNKKY